MPNFVRKYNKNFLIREGEELENRLQKTRECCMNRDHFRYGQGIYTLAAAVSGIQVRTNTGDQRKERGGEPAGDEWLMVKCTVSNTPPRSRVKLARPWDWSILLSQPEYT